jgi:hypothetical protein
MGKHKTGPKGKPLTISLISDEMVEKHLQGLLSIRDIGKTIKKAPSTIHEALAEKIESFNKGYQIYALARAKYQALKYLNEVLADKNLDDSPATTLKKPSKDSVMDSILRAKNKVRADMTIKTLEGLGIFKGETPIAFPEKIIFQSNVPIPGFGAKLIEKKGKKTSQGGKA